MLLTCSRSHQWERTVPGSAPRDTCPQCGGMPVALPTIPPPAVEADGATLEPASLPTLPTDKPEVPGYDIQGILGLGGMGVVYRAWHRKLKRTVALKMILTGQGADRIQRFRLEAEAVARLQHPNVVQVFEVGEAAGRPYLALEFIDGPNLAQRLSGSPLPPRQAAAITVTLAQAVQAAHDHRIVHRDLKPANVLLTSKGMPKIADFGLAKQLDDDRGQTQSGAVLGTPSYMAPEQALGRTRGVGPPADVYALGAILYEMLTGRPPFKADTPLNTIYQVVSDDVLPPSRLQPKMPLDLETICLKCLEKDPRRRYDTALALADDLRNFLGGRTVTARPTPLWERVWKWAKRRPAAAALLAVCALGVFSYVIGGLYFTNRLRVEKNRAVEEKVRAEKSEADAITQQQRAEREKALADERLETSQRARYTGQIWRVDGLWQKEPLVARQLLLDPANCPPERRDFAWRLYDRVCNIRGLAIPAPFVSSLALSPDGKMIAAAGQDGGVRLWDRTTGKEVAVLGQHPDGVNAIAYSRDGRFVATGGGDKIIRLWDPRGRTQLGVLEGHNSEVRALAFTPDSKTLASTAAFEDPKEKNSDIRMKNGEVFLWDVESRKGGSVYTEPGGILCLAVSPDGTRVAAGTTHRDELVLIGVAEKKKVAGPFKTGTGWVQALAFRPPDGKFLAVGKADNRIRLWDVEAGRQVQNLRGHLHEVESVRFSPDGKTLATGSMDGVVKLWDVEFPRNRVEEKTSFRGHQATVNDLAFVDNTTLASAGYDGVRTWRLPGQLERSSLQGDNQGFHAAALSADGKTLLTGNRSRGIGLWDVAAGKSIRTLSGHGGPVIAAAFSADQRAVTSVAYLLDSKEHEILNWELKVWDLVNGVEKSGFRKPGAAVFRLVLAPDGGTVAVSQMDGNVSLWDVQGRQLGVLAGPPELVSALTFTPDGRSLVGTTAAGRVRIWDVTTKTERLSFQAHPSTIHGLACSRDGTILATAGTEQSQGRLVAGVAIKLWDASSGKLRLELPAPLDIFQVLAFSPDARTLAAGGNDCTVKLWDTTSGHLRTVLTGHTRRITGLGFTPDGDTLVSTSGVLHDGWWVKEGEIKIWDAGKGPL